MDSSLDDSRMLKQATLTISNHMPKREKKPDLKTKVGKYYLGVKKGKTKTQAALDAGYKDATHITQIERTDTFQAIQRYFKDELVEKITISEIADELVKVIRQDKDLGAKNKSIEMALSRIEPDKHVDDNDDRVLVIMKKG
jgi:hypothetical protein